MPWVVEQSEPPTDIQKRESILSNKLSKNKETPKNLIFEVSEKRRRPTLPRCNAVPSARVGLTSLFGMGRGGTPLL